MRLFQIFRPDMEEAKEVHKCLRTAAGIFSYVKVLYSFILVDMLWTIVIFLLTLKCPSSNTWMSYRNSLAHLSRRLIGEL